MAVWGLWGGDVEESDGEEHGSSDHIIPPLMRAEEQMPLPSQNHINNVT